MTCDSAFHWNSAARTDVGLVRSRNEDAYLAQPKRGLWAVADGMGGHAYGDVASRMVVDALAMLPAPDNMTRFIFEARECIGGINHDLRIEAAARRVPVMGSTVVALLACGNELACLWAGDSRIYLYRDARLQQLTRDHSQAQVLHARSGAVSSVITRAVGAADTLDLEQAVLNAHDGDMLLLCSDGLSNMVDEHGIGAALAGGDCAQAAQVLVALALANGGRDNVTVVVARADDVYGDRTMHNPAL
ncbi:MAG: protein phosphatase 2C domain-containing protein [Pseudomonadota bacterium]